MPQAEIPWSYPGFDPHKNCLKTTISRAAGCGGQFVSPSKFDSYSGQSYKQFTIVIYDSRVVPDLKIPLITTLDS